MLRGVMEDLSKLELYQLMDLVKPVTAPEPVSWVPQTYGWLFLVIILCLMLIIRKWQKRRLYLARQHRFQAISLINKLDDNATALDISTILKRCALCDFSRERIAPLTGDEWASFLNQQAGQPGLFKSFYSYSQEEINTLKQSAIHWLTHYEVTQ